METIDVPGFSPRYGPTKLRFTMYGAQRCVFSQISDARVTTSSINLAESIIIAICEQEGLELQRVRFFDLQTALGYPKGYLIFCEGDFHFDELIMDADACRVKHWRPTLCPSFVTDDFLPQMKVRQTQRVHPDAIF